MEQCVQDNDKEILKTGRSLLESLVEIVNDVRTGRQQAIQNSGEIHGQESGSEDLSSGESGEEDDLVQQQQQTESVQELQEELTRLEISEEASTLETLIIIVEHYVKTNDVEGFRKNVRRPDMWLLSQPRPKIADLISMAENLEKQELPFRALMMYKAVCALYKYEYAHHPSEEDSCEIISPNMAVSGIEETMGKVFDIFNDIISKDKFEMYLVHFIPIMYDMLTNLREIRHADRKHKADLEAWGLLYICIVFGLLQDVTQMNDVAETIVKTSEKRFKKKAQKYLVYGIGMFALSVAKFFSRRSTAEEDYAKKGVKALQESKGLPSWDDKVQLVSKAESFAQKLESLRWN